MSVYVDDLRMFPTTLRTFAAGSCHMTADSMDELHLLASRIGLKREWFQRHATAPHYDLNASKREAALAAGAVYMPAKEQARNHVGRTIAFGGPMPNLENQQ